MPDNLPGLSGDMGAGKPLTPGQWEKRERERKALDVYTKTFSFPQVRLQLDLRDNEVAEQIVRAGWERYRDEEDEWGAQVYRKAMREGLEELHVLLMRMARDEDASNQLSAIDRLMKVWERMAKLEDLDKRKEEGGSGPSFVIVDGRLPFEREPRGEIVEGQVEGEGDGPQNDEGPPKEP